MSDAKPPVESYDIVTPYGVVTIHGGSFSPQIKLVCNTPWVPHRLTWDEDSGVAWIDLRRANIEDGGVQ